MKYAMMALTTFLFLVGSFGLSFAKTTIPSIDPYPIERSLDTAEGHLSKAQNLEKEIQHLENKVSELNQEFAKYIKKPYLDAKGFRRNGLKLLIGTSVKKIASIRELVAWHRAEATRLAAVENGSQESTSDSKATPTTMKDSSRSGSNESNENTS